MKPLLLPTVFAAISLCSCFNTLPSGNMTLIRGQVANIVNGEPLPNHAVFIEECEYRLWFNFTCRKVDTFYSDANGKFEYAFFHDDLNDYHLAVDTDSGYSCAPKINVPGGEFVDADFKLTPWDHLLHIDISFPQDSISFPRLNVNASKECLSFSDFLTVPANTIGIDTTISLHVPGNKELEISFSAHIRRDGMSIPLQRKRNIRLLSKEERILFTN